MSHAVRRVLWVLNLAATLILLLPTSNAIAQTINDSKELDARLSALEQRLQTLDQQAAEIRAEIVAIRLQVAPAPDEADDLMSVELVGDAPSRPPSTPSEDAPESLVGIEAIVNTLPANSATIFNPKISMVGNVVGSAGNSGGEARDSVALEEGELSLEAVVDPYTKAKFFIGFADGDVAIEEGFAQFLHLPFDTTAKVGKFRSSFGKFNALHFHQWSTIDEPLVIQEFFGDEGLTDSGVSLSRILQAPSSVFMEVTGEVTRGSIEGVFEPANRDDLLYLGHLELYRDFGDSSNVELGGTWASGMLPDGSGRRSFTAADVTYRWKPLGRSIYRSFLGRGEIIWSQRDDQTSSALGYYVSGDHQFARRWTAGARYDRVDHPENPSLTDDGASFVLTFRPSEFSLVRGQYRRTNRPFGDDADEFLMQLQFAIGAHGAHAF